MRVFCVFVGEYSARSLGAVFATLEEAVEYHNGDSDSDIEIHEVGVPHAEVTGFEVAMSPEGEIKTMSRHKYGSTPTLPYVIAGGDIAMTIPADTEDAAKKIAGEWHARFMAARKVLPKTYLSENPAITIYFTEGKPHA